MVSWIILKIKVAGPKLKVEIYTNVVKGASLVRGKILR